MRWVKLIGVVGLAVTVYIWYELLTGPTMRYTQPNIRPYHAAMPLPPEGAVPVEDVWPALPTTAQATTMKVSIPATPANIARGKVYYGYYCAFCHGPSGDGRVPVGESFVPAPADLRSPKVRSMSDGQLLRAMLTGDGHRPILVHTGKEAVLEYTVLPEHRDYLVLYVRSLGK
ncbi:MAG: cytochrome c [Phycisphaerae bacterium]